MPIVTIDKQNMQFKQPKSITLLKAALGSGLGFPYECSTGSCGSCRFTMVDGDVRQIGSRSNALTEKDRSKGRYLACQSSAVTDCTIKVHLSDQYVPRFRPERFSATLSRRRTLAPGFHEYTFQGPGPALFRAGQYALISHPDVQDTRAYSMANIANDLGEWVFQVRVVPNGEMSNLLSERMVPGDQLTLEGPYGVAFLRDEINRDVVCIAGGAGLAPMLSIVRGAAASGLLSRHRLQFYYGARTGADLCGENELRELDEFGTAISYAACVSDDPAPGVNNKYVHDLVRQEVGDFSDKEFYVAGPPQMVEAVVKLLALDRGVSQARIHYDRFF